MPRSSSARAPARPLAPSIDPAFVLAVDQPVRRDLTCVNVRREDKAAFDQLAAVYALRWGKPLTQWEAFNVLLAEGLERAEGELRVARRA